MAENVYEGMFILDSNRYARDGAALAGEIGTTIAKFGGQLLISRLWDERRLAYPIDGHRKGTYWLTYFKLDSVKLASLEREFHLNEGVLRMLFLRIDPRLVDALVEHAKTGTVPETRPGERPQRTEGGLRPHRGAAAVAEIAGVAEIELPDAIEGI